jgi:hypothetical protein
MATEHEQDTNREDEEERNRQLHVERTNHIELGLAFMLDQELDLVAIDGEAWTFKENKVGSPSYGEFPSPADALAALGKRNGDIYGL